MKDNKKESFKSIKESKKIQKGLAVTCLAIFGTVNTSSAVMAMSTTGNKLGVNKTVQKKNNDVKKLKREKKQSANYEQMKKVMLGKKQEEKQSKSDKFIYAKDIKQTEDTSILSKKPDKAKLAKRTKSTKVSQKAKVAKAAEAMDQNYTLASLSSMKYEDMMNAIASTSWDKIPGLFENNSDSRTFFNDRERFKYMISDLSKRGAEFTANDNKGIPTIVEVIRAGFYLGYYNQNEFPGIWDESMTKLCLPAMDAILNNKNLSIDSGYSVIEALGALIGNTTVSPEIMNKIVDKILVPFRNNSVKYLGDYYQANSVYKVIGSIGFVLNMELDTYKKQPAQNYPSYGKIDKYIDEMCEIAGTEVAYSDDQWYMDNGISYAAGYAFLHSDSNKVLRKFTEIMDSTPKYSATYFGVAWEITDSLGGSNSRGEKIDFDKLAEEGNDYWMPNEYVFDDGAIVIHAGDKVAPEKIERMYWATKEVESQFFRVNGNDKALEPDNKDKVLTIRLFNSPNEYKMNEYLNGINTDNGGMYIEPSGSFYTYERTEAESVYSLEELFRHEFTHYLQGKYQVPGLWGQGDFYNNSDIEWFDEGTAEFFAGSTRTEGVQPRKAIVGYLDKDQSKRFTLNTLIKSGYNSGWEFYNYGWAFVSYMYNNDIEKMMQINDSIMKYKINDFRNILNNAANNSSVESKYQQFMDNVLNDSTLTTPLVSDAYVANHEKRSLSQIKNDIISVSGVNNFVESKTNSGKFGTFKLEGKYKGGVSKDRASDWKEMNLIANNMLKSLSAKGWSGYDTVTCYFTDYKVVNGAYEFNIVFKGLLNDGSSTGSIIKPKVLTKEVESNDSMEEADKNGVIGNNVELKAVSSDSSDADYYAFEVDKAGKVNIKITGGSSKLTWVVFRADDLGSYSCWSQYTDGDSTTGSFDAKEGKYYIKVYPVSTSISNQEYSVLIDGIKSYTVTEPGTEPGSGSEEIPPVSKNDQEQEPNDDITSANLISNNKDMKATLSAGGENDMFMFDVAKAGKVDIKVNSKSNQYTWVVFKETDPNSFVCWSQYSDAEGSSGSFDAKEGKYYIMVYSVNGNAIDYTLNVNGIK